MSIIVILAIIFVIWLIVANINAMNEGKRQMRESAWLKSIREKYPEAYNEYFTWEARKRHGRDMKSELMGWTDKRWEMENNMLIVKKNQRIRSEKEEKWAKEQHDFAEKCVEIAKKTMPGFGYYKYFPQVSTITKDGKPSKMKMLVWQHFPEGLCLCEDLDYTNVQYAKNNLANLQFFKRKTRYFTDVVYDKIIAFIKELRKDDEVLVYLNYNIEDWDSDVLTYHYNKIKEGLANSNITTSLTRLPNGEKSVTLDKLLKRKIVIIDMMTEKHDLNFNCVRIFEDIREKQPLISYFSFLKCYDRQEMSDNIKNANAEAEKRAAEERAKEEERKRKEAEEAKRKEEELAEKKRKEEERVKLLAQAPTIFIENVKTWEHLYGNFYYNYLFYYYPVNIPNFEATQEEWWNRRNVWDFKNDPDKNILPEDHETTLKEIIPQIRQKLSDTFGEEYLQFLTLACLPASTKVKNIARYEDFSNRLCAETGMINGYPYITIVKDGLPRHETGQSVPPEVAIADWFYGKYVLLFDDVITRGRTMLRYKEILERKGAIVVGGFTLGKTKHERPIQGGMPNPSTQLFPPQSTTFSNNDFELPF